MKKRRSAKSFLCIIDSTCSMLGFSETVNNREKEMGAQPPNVKRPFDRVNQVSFHKQVSFYIIKIRTSANRERGIFNPTGKIKILVTNPIPGKGEEIVLYRSFQRRPGVGKKVALFLTALDLELSARPSDSKGKMMNLVEVSPRRSVWRSVNFKRNKEEKEMFLSLPDFIASFVEKKQHQWNYYQDVLRKRRGVKRYEKDIIKKWKIENPENAVPSVY